SLKNVVKAGDKGHTVLYFWTSSQKGHFLNVRQQVKDLQEKYPDYRFVGINLRTSFPQWNLLLEEYGLDKTDQYHGENFKEIQTTMVLDRPNNFVLSKVLSFFDGFANTLILYNNVLRSPCVQFLDLCNFRRYFVFCSPPEIWPIQYRSTGVSRISLWTTRA